MRKLDDRVVGVSLSPEVLDIINNHLHTAAINPIHVNSPTSCKSPVYSEQQADLPRHLRGFLRQDLHRQSDLH